MSTLKEINEALKVVKKAGNNIRWGNLSTNSEIIYLWTPENLNCPEFYTGGPKGNIWLSIPIFKKD